MFQSSLAFIKKANYLIVYVLTFTNLRCTKVDIRNMSKEMSTMSTLNIEQASSYCNKSTKTLRRWVKRGLKHKTRGNSYAFTKRDLDTFMMAKPDTRVDKVDTKDVHEKNQDDALYYTLKNEVSFLRSQLENRDKQMTQMFDKLTNLTEQVTQQNEKLSMLAQSDKIEQLRKDPVQVENSIINVTPKQPTRAELISQAAMRIRKLGLSGNKAKQYINEHFPNLMQ